MTEVGVATELVVTVNVLEVEPAGMVTLAGTAATEALLLDRLTTAPILGAAALSTGLLTATTAPTAGGRDKSPGSHRSRWPDRLYTEPAWGGAVHVVWPTSMR